MTQTARDFLFALSAAGAMAMAAGDISTVVAIDDHDPSDTLDRISFGGEVLTVLNTGVPQQAPSADLWAVVFTTSGTPGGADQVLVIGGGGSFAAAAREGVTTFAPDAALTFLAESPTINDAGQWALGFAAQDLGAASPLDLDERALVATPDGSGGYTFETVAAAFDDLRLRGANPFSPPLGNIGDVDDVLIANDGGVAFFDTAFFSEGSGRETDAYLTGVIPGSPSPFGVVAGAEAETVPAGQVPASSTRPLESVFDFAINADGTSFILEGNLEDDSDVDIDGDGVIDFVFGAEFADNGDVMVVDGTVVSQAGSIFPATNVTFTSPVDSDDNPVMNAAGAYAFELTNADGTNYAVVDRRDGNGPLAVAIEGEPIVPGSTETWSSITKVLLDGAGNVLVVGTTDNSAAYDTVAVRNGTAVVLREGEAIDVDADGSIDGFVNLISDRTILSNDGSGLYAAMRLRTVSADNDSAFRLGGNSSSLFRVPISRTAIVLCAADFSDEGGVGVLNLFDILKFFELFGTSDSITDVNGDGTLDLFDVLGFFAAFGGCSL